MDTAKNNADPNAASPGQQQPSASPLPSIALPKGGGAIQGMGEKFDVNPTTGTGSMTIPIGVSPARGLEPVLSLSYNSGSGNGPFGFGWSLSLGSITRKTSRGIPRYLDAIESDTFVFAGVEDLVPVLQDDGSVWENSDTLPGYIVKRYRPRIEGPFSRIERCSNQSDPADVWWRVMDAKNQLTVYGSDANSRVYDPQNPSRIFEWLTSEVRDQKGNVTWFRYKEEDGAGVDLAKAHQQSRGPVDDVGRRSNRYIKSIVYGNLEPLLDPAGNRPQILSPDLLRATTWLFEVVFDYGEHVSASPSPQDSGTWDYRSDPFSSYRSGFEVRTTRLCRRVLMFHHFKHEKDIGENYLVSSVDFKHSQQDDPRHNPVYSFITAVSISGYRTRDGNIVSATAPPVEFEYTQPELSDRIEIADEEIMENLPNGLSGVQTQWIDLFGEGISGALTQYDGSWYYKRNLSPLTSSTKTPVQQHPTFLLGPMENLDLIPNMAPDSPEFDIVGDGYHSFIPSESRPTGFFKATEEDTFDPFQAFTTTVNHSLKHEVRFLDIDGDGRPELVLAGDSLTWSSLGVGGFNEGQSFSHWAPGLLFCNDSEVIHLADVSGDGLADIVRVRNGESCYWPNLGNGSFGDQIVLDNSPWFDYCDRFSSHRVLLTDIDGSGTTDIVYLHSDGPMLYFNQSGNEWSNAVHLSDFPPTHNIASVTALDLHGQGTPSLVWFSSLPSDARQSLRYLRLMKTKPHLMVKVSNNLGCITAMTYATSTQFYLEDKVAGSPWATRLPFPVHVVCSRVVEDVISKNRFTTRYAYHHGYYDGDDAEFRGFGMVESWSSELVNALDANPTLSNFLPVNEAEEHSLPPTYTKQWFHLGNIAKADKVSLQYEHEYYRPATISEDEARKWLLPDTTLPPGLSTAELRDACRALKGTLLRAELYTNDAGLNASAATVTRAKIPHTITETNYLVKVVQRKLGNKYPVFYTSQSQTLNMALERSLVAHRLTHTQVLETNKYGQILRQLTISYGADDPDPSLPTEWDRQQQLDTKIMYMETKTTNAIDDPLKYPFAHRLPIVCEAKAFELTGFTGGSAKSPYELDYWVANNFQVIDQAELLAFETAPDASKQQRRLLQHQRTLFRKDDLSGLLPLSVLESQAFGGEHYNLVFTKAMLSLYLQKGGLPLLANADQELLGNSSNQGGYISGESKSSAGLFPVEGSSGTYWGPSGQTFFSGDTSPADELALARKTFFLPKRFRGPFGVESSVEYDDYNLFVLESTDGVGNKSTVGDRDGGGVRTSSGMDYRVLKPRLVTDMNRNQTAVCYDAFGREVARAAMGKAEENVGDSVADVIEDYPEEDVIAYLDNPMVGSEQLLASASSRTLFDAFAYYRTKDTENPLPARAYVMQRTEHSSGVRSSLSKINRVFAYSDGFGRTIQSKVQCRPGPVPLRDGQGNVIVDDNGQAIMSTTDSDPRWITSGWAIFNNKGKVVRAYEPFFTDLHAFEFGIQIGVSSITFYDAAERACASVMPNNTFTKVVYNPWYQEGWDSGDTLLRDPRTDSDTAPYTAKYFKAHPEYQTWYQMRINNQLGADEREAAEKCAAYSETPMTTYFDSLGRGFLTVARHRVQCPGHEFDGRNELLYSRVELDIQGNRVAILDSVIQGGDQLGRVLERSQYDMQGDAMHSWSAEKGESWALKNVLGSPMKVWDSRGQLTRSEYDAAGRPVRTYLQHLNAGTPELLITRLVYGESHPEAEDRNLRGAIYLSLDQSGMASIDRHDFKANTLENSSRLCKEYKNEVDWSAVEALLPAALDDQLNLTALTAGLSQLLEEETFIATATFDALSRPLAAQLPHSNGSPASAVRFSYVVGSLDTIECNIRDETAADGSLVWNPFVQSLEYDAKGQRKRILYGNAVSTDYEYNNIGQLVKSMTRKNRNSLADNLQSLSYVYDTQWNITRIRDDARQTYFFRNQITQPSSSYYYDSLYRLIKSSAREHIGQTNGAPTPYSDNDSGRFENLPGQENAMANYQEFYVYDAATNFQKMVHVNDGNSALNWTRTYSYLEQSMIEPNKTCNKLTSTSTGNVTTTYTYDEHGNMTRVPHLGGSGSAANMEWDFMDRLRHLDLGGGGHAYYTYNQTGQRVRKVIERGPNLIEERIYLGDMELYRKRSTTELLLERETLHVHDDHGRIALVESRSGGSSTTDRAPARLIRYQLTDHLDSSALEIDDEARVLTYEEYAAYGNTTYQAKSPSLETPKRYRYTGKERDEESGFSQHGARYLAVWLGRWLTADPGGLADGGNLYAYVRGNPITMTDPSGHEGKNKYQDYQLTIDEIHPKLGDPADPMSGPQSVKEAYWRATSADNKQFLWEHHNNVRKGGWDFYADNKLVDQAPATGTSVKTEPAAMLDKNWGHTEELKAVLAEAMENLRTNGDPKYPNLKTEESQLSSNLETAKAEAADLNSALNREAGEVIKSSSSSAATSIRDHIKSSLRGVAQKGRPLIARLKEPPKWSRPGEAPVASSAPAPASTATKSPAPPEITPPSAPSAPEPATPTETTPIENPPATEVAEASAGASGKGGGARALGAAGKVLGYGGMLGAAGAVLRDVDKGYYTGAAKTTALVGGLAAVAKYGTKFGALGKFAGSKVPIIGWGLMAYGTYQNLSSDEAHASRDAASSWVTEHTDSKVLGAIAGGGAQLATAAYKTVVSDTLRDIKDGAGVLVSWGKKLF